MNRSRAISWLNNGTRIPNFNQRSPKELNLCHALMCASFRSPKELNLCRALTSVSVRSPKERNLCHALMSASFRSPKELNLCYALMSVSVRSPKELNLCRALTSVSVRSPKERNLCHALRSATFRSPKDFNVNNRRLPPSAKPRRGLIQRKQNAHGERTRYFSMPPKGARRAPIQITGMNQLREPVGLQYE